MSVDPITALPSRPSPGVAGARLGELYAEHSRMVYGVCRMLLRDPNEAEDATQQVFLAAYSNLLTGTEVRDPAAWLGTIARNACRRRAAMRMREPLAVADGPTLVSPAADETAIDREEAAALYAQLAVLPDKQREAVVLRDLYGLRYDEVARALGTSRPAVEALLFRGRRRLQRGLRPGIAAGVLVVPLAVQESLAYAVPGFAGTAVPAGAVAAAAGIPFVAKLAAAGAAVGIVGSAGVVADRTVHDAPVRPLDATIVQPRPTEGAESAPAALISVPPGGFPIVPASHEDDGSSVAGGDDEDGAANAGEDEVDSDERLEEEHDEAEEDADDAEDGADETEDRAEDARDDRSGPGGGDEEDAESDLDGEDRVASEGDGDDDDGDSESSGLDSDESDYEDD